MALEPELQVIQPSRGWVPLNLREVWYHRELLYFLVWRDVKVRYKQTVLGALWAVIQPFFTMIVFSLFFGKLAGIKAPYGLPYPLFTFAALVPWNYFSQSFTSAADSLVGSGHLIKKVYFPRLIIPLSGIIAGLVDFSIAFGMLLVLMVWFGVCPGANIIFLPLFLMLAIVTALAVSLWLSALNVVYRDVRFTLGFIAQFWMLATPVAYPSSLLSEPWRTVYGLNPMAGVVEGFRWSLLDMPEPPGPMIGVSVLATLLLLTGGLYFFRRMERKFSDLT